MKNALLVMSNALTARNTLQVLECGGVAAQHVSEIPTESFAGNEPLLICAPSAAAATLTQRVASNPRAKLVFYADAPNPELLTLAARTPQVVGMLGLRYPGAPPRPWELVALARRLSAATCGPASAFLAWGHSWEEHSPSNPAERDVTVGTVESYARRFMAERRAQSVAELAHELLMNAMYDAPVDQDGKPLFAHRRKEQIQLDPKQRPTIGFGSDGVRLVISVEDPFGRLAKEVVFAGLARSVGSGRMDQTGGGAGLGFLLIYQSATVIWFDVAKGKSTRVTAVLELDVPMREMRKLPRSIHFLNY